MVNIAADKTITLAAVKTRAQALADATIRAERAHANFLAALDYAYEDGATGPEIAQAIDAASVGRPDRGQALARLRATKPREERDRDG